MALPDLNRETVSVVVREQDVRILLQNPSEGAWSIVHVAAGRLPPLPYREEAFATREAAVQKGVEIAEGLLA